MVEWMVNGQLLQTAKPEPWDNFLGLFSPRTTAEQHWEEWRALVNDNRIKESLRGIMGELPVGYRVQQ